MSRTNDRRAGLISVDVFAAFAAVFAGVLVRYGASYRSIWEGELSLPPVWILALCFAVLAFVSFSSSGTYRRETYWSIATELTDLGKGLVFLGALTLSFLFLFKLEDVSRAALGFSFLALSGISTGVRLALRRRALRTQPERLSRWLLVGVGERSDEIADLVARHPHVGARIVGLVGDGHQVEQRVPWLGSIADLPEVLRTEVIDEVIVTLDAGDWNKLEGVLAACAQQGKTVRMPLNSVAPTVLKGRLEEFDDMPMWSVLATPQQQVALAVKRIFDVAAATSLLLILSPLLIATAVSVRIRDGGPVFYAQWRSGLHGRAFRMVKFRTMVNGAEAMRADLMTSNERVGPAFKMADDPRVTKLGRTLRKWSIDELPQLWNVVMGHMSLVGPRPQPVDEVQTYQLWHRRRLSMRPGVTGLWQVTARNDPSFDVWMDLDLVYIDRWSLWMDASILLRTPAALVRMPGT